MASSKPQRQEGALSHGMGVPKDYDASRFEHPSVTVDVVLLSILEGALHTLLVKRAEAPFMGVWALPGGFVRMDESLEDAALRVLRSKTGLDHVFLEQLFTFGDPARDPRTRVLSVAHYALLDRERFRELEGKDMILARVQVPWEGERGGPAHLLDRDGSRLELAFDHSDMVALTVKRLRGKLDYSPVAFQLLSECFTLYDLQKVHEAILGRKLNKDAFRKRLLATGLLAPTGTLQQDVDHRPAALYRYVQLD